MNGNSLFKSDAAEYGDFSLGKKIHIVFNIIFKSLNLEVTLISKLG